MMERHAIVFTITKISKSQCEVKTKSAEFKKYNLTGVGVLSVFLVMEQITRTLNNEHGMAVLFEVE